ncbi:HAD family hydrolase [uncultured Limosilactobacillus sp.]|uniref:HAD family hydrolase n=1 Tax=uncultured Limosilactobacillus sp. TaxID=2837629 RepID=UPI0025CC6BF5|nr:HAD family hydrolase [uncultured Limosilactobacillus sp.]
MKYFISDLDHTLLNEQAKLSLETIRVIKSNQLPLMLCSARLPKQMDPFIQQLNLTSPQAALNGALIFEGIGEDRRIQAKHAISLSIYQQIKELMRKKFPDYPVTWMDEEKWYLPRLTADLTPELQYCQADDYIIGMNQPLNDPLLLLIVIPDANQFKAVFTCLQQTAIPEIQVVNSGDGYLTITGQGVNKGLAPQYLLEHHLAVPKEIVAVGDDENDLPMFKRAGISVAVANAAPSVRMQADIVGDTNENDGVARIMERLL